MKRVLIFGPEPLSPKPGVEWIHVPLIKVVPLPLQKRQQALEKALPFDGVIVTSKRSVQLLKETQYVPAHRPFYAVGRATYAKIVQLYSEALCPETRCPSITIYCAKDERQEGIIELLNQYPVKQYPAQKLFWPKAARARTLLEDYPGVIGATFYDIAQIYSPDQPPSLPFDQIDEILFTSPSTVESFFNLFPPLKRSIHSKMQAIGPVTDQILSKAILSKLKESKNDTLHSS